MAVGTVIRITSGAKRKRYLIVVPGEVDIKRRGQVWRAQKRNRVYRIREYPLGVMPGQTVSFEDLEERKGKYWEAEIPGLGNDARPESKLSPLEQEIRSYPNLAPERASNVISGLSMLVSHIKNGWDHSTSGWMGDRYTRPLGSRNPFETYIQDYVELESPTWRENEIAVKDYRAILHAWHGRSVETRRRVGGGDSWLSYQQPRLVERDPDELLGFLRDEVRIVLDDKVMAKDLHRFEKWVERQKSKFKY
jgi:hypothetical protein